jgi:DNA-binding CsgD family transcriptional regulator
VALRGVSPRTVANQIASVFRKLGVHSRLELQAWLARVRPE